MDKIKIFEMFAGFGGASFALKKAGIPFERVGFSEIDKYAVQCYEQNHRKRFKCTGGLFRPNFERKIYDIPKNFGDCTKINPNDIPDFDLLTGGFPCQSFSVAGKGLGELDTRGTLFNEIIRIAEVKKPKFMLLENVKGLTTKRHKATFEKILSELERIGYNVKWKVLNSKEHGIPQNRERVFFVCKYINFGDEMEYWDAVNLWEDNPLMDEPLKEDFFDFYFEFPEKEELKIFLKDILESEVDEKYYLKQNQIDNLLKNNNMNCNPSGKGINGKVHIGNISPTITTNKGEGAKIIQVNSPKHSNNRVYDKAGISPTLNTMGGGNRQPFVALRTNTKKGYDEAIPGDGIRLEQPNSKTARGRVLKQVSGTLLCNEGRGVLTNDFRIRKLTPKECFRLMGFLNDEINLEGLSNTQRYKLAGNGWDINLVSKIFKKMFL